MFGKRGSHLYLSYGTRSDPRTTPRHTSTSEKGPKIWVLLADYGRRLERIHNKM